MTHHKVQRIDVEGQGRAYRLFCSCGWQSSVMRSPASVVEAWQHHSQPCQRWGTGLDQCVKPYDHLGPCKTRVQDTR
jgi:hypothetical protein